MTNENLLHEICKNIAKKYTSFDNSEDIAQDAAIILYNKYSIIEYDRKYHNLIWQIVKFTAKNANKKRMKLKENNAYSFNKYDTLSNCYDIENETNNLINGNTAFGHLIKFIRLQNEEKASYKKRHIKYRILLDHIFKGISLKELAIKYNKKYNTITSLVYIAKEQFKDYLETNNIDLKKLL